ICLAWLVSSAHNDAVGPHLPLHLPDEMQHRNVTQVQDTDTRAARFETHRPHLRAVATRLLGSPTEAEDAVQEAWLRLDRAGDEQIEILGGWLTTVVSRICLDHLRARSTRSEEPVDA